MSAAILNFIAVSNHFVKVVLLINLAILGKTIACHQN